MNANDTQSQTFTGRRRSRKTSPRVIAGDRLARVLITLGGWGTILAVSAVCLFLLWVALPLLLPESITSPRQSELNLDGGTPHTILPDDYGRLFAVAGQDGNFRTYRADNGGFLAEKKISTGSPLTAWSLDRHENRAVFAFADKTLRTGTVKFATAFVDEAEIPESAQNLARGEVASFREGILERTPEGQFRYETLQIELQAPVAVDTPDNLALVDRSVSIKGDILAVLTDSGELRVAQVTERKNLLTGQVTRRLREGKVVVQMLGGQLPTHLLLSDLGDTLYLIWDDGELRRFDTRDITNPMLAESRDLVEAPAGRITALTFLAGKAALVCGDSLGNIRVWFRTRPADADTVDGVKLVAGHAWSGGRPIVDLAASSKSRLLAAADDAGHVRLYHTTSEQLLAEVAAAVSSPRTRLTVTPKDDALLAVGAGELRQWTIHAPHPEVTLGTLLRPVWYEGYEQPEHVWQSEGSEGTEEKYGVLPLIFGTLKATCYSMLFGAPLALLAAIYTSQFMNPKMRARIKPTIEIMASLPSVVLGFLAGLVIARWAEDVVPQCLSLLVTIPVACMLCAHLWQLLPDNVAVRARRLRLVGVLIAIGLGVWSAWRMADPVEQWLFAGDIKAWLDGQIGNGAGAWMFVLLPVTALVMVWLNSLYVTPYMRRFCGGWSRTPFALVDLTRFLLSCGAMLAVAYGLSLLLSQGWDPRGTYVDTYVQRNAMVVGFAMGFAIIPIIYTISDDALAAVPESLRAASLGTGATLWQTAVRVVIPTAMSGLFSALMVGLGRAVGETMIVLMAAGNTPIMKWNAFDGFRTLSANIAVEMSEAVRNSTHYRVLFLTALVLFAITFVVNTIAEIVRQRFRKRAFQL